VKQRLFETIKDFYWVLCNVVIKGLFWILFRMIIYYPGIVVYTIACYVFYKLMGRYPSNEDIVIYSRVLRAIPYGIYIQIIKPAMEPHVNILIAKFQLKSPFLYKHIICTYPWLKYVVIRFYGLVVFLSMSLIKLLVYILVEVSYYLYKKVARNTDTIYSTTMYLVVLCIFFIFTTIVYYGVVLLYPHFPKDIIEKPEIYDVLNIYSIAGFLSTAFLFLNIINLITLANLCLCGKLIFTQPNRPENYTVDNLYNHCTILDHICENIYDEFLKHSNGEIIYNSSYVPTSTLSLNQITNTLNDFILIPLSVLPTFFFFFLLFFTSVFSSWLFFSYLGLYGVFKLNIITLFLFWASLINTFSDIFTNQKVYVIKLFDWVFLTTSSKVNCSFYIDSISFSFIFLTTTIALFVFIYAFSYFRYEPLVDRFLLYILYFVISMILLVSSANIIMLFLGWELIGLTSFLLINFWTTKTGTMKSSFKAYTFNKVSDFFMFILLLLLYNTYYTFEITSINNQAQLLNLVTITTLNTQININEFIAFSILGASFIKSAQFGGHAWLPDSMEAPVPASSLIHSATLVSAGIYLILRFNPIFSTTEFSKLIIPVVGSFTAAYGGICAVAQSDIKKTLAYSTISHCGFLMVLCASGLNEFAILYLYVHGFFKAGVFMCVGNVLRITKGYQDTRRMGGLAKYLPFEYFVIFVGLVNLAGIPFTFGFFIKHLLFVSLETYIYIYYFVLINSLIGALSGLFYSYRIITYTFNDFKKADKSVYTNTNRESYNSKHYTNTSKASTIAILGLFISSYVITYILFKYFIYNNQLFSDCLNTTILSTYYTVALLENASHTGFLLNFAILNVVVVLTLTGLYFSKYRRVERFDLLLTIIYAFFVVIMITFITFTLFN